MSVARRQGVLRRVILRRGTTVKLEDPSQTFNTSTLDTSGTAAAETNSCTPPSTFRADLIDGTHVVQGDLEVQVNAADWTTVTPANGLLATIDSETYHVIAASPLFEDTTVYGYRLQLRGTQ